MKTIIKIEIAILVLVLLVGGAMCAISAGVLELLEDPVIVEYDPVPIATDAPTEPVVPEVTEPKAPQPQETATKQPVEKTTKSTGTQDLITQKYFVYDVREGEYLRKAGSETEKLYPASITKLLTTYVVLQHLKPDEIVVAGDALELVPL